MFFPKPEEAEVDATHTHKRISRFSTADGKWNEYICCVHVVEVVKLLPFHPCTDFLFLSLNASFAQSWTNPSQCATVDAHTVDCFISCIIATFPIPSSSSAPLADSLISYKLYPIEQFKCLTVESINFVLNYRNLGFLIYSLDFKQSYDWLFTIWSTTSLSYRDIRGITY